jgi:outer membrane protein assembly factor BamB
MSHPRIFALLSVVFVAANLIVATARAENWPQWRGPGLDGISSEMDLPTRWSQTENVAWRVPLPGPAGSTPVIWDDKIFLTSVDRDRLVLLCVSTSGKPLWRQDVTSGNRDVRGDEGNSAAPSPSTDGRHVWVCFADGTLACYTVEGAEVWKYNLQSRYGRFNIAFGMTATPLLDGDRLYLQLIHGEGNPRTQDALVVAINAQTGEGIWRQQRITGASSENEHSYASPALYRDSQREFLITHGGDYVIAHRLTDGGELWRCCLNPQGALYHPTLRFVASPVAAAGRIVVPSAKNGPVLCLRPDISGDVTDDDSALYWIRQRGTPDVPSPLISGDLVYLCRENGNLVCVDAETGEEFYEQRTTADRHRASPVYADGNIYLTARSGMVTVVKAGRRFEILAQNDLAEPMSASPAISNGRIYLRTFDALYAIGDGQ